MTTDPETIERLLPCPFCGSQPKFHDAGCQWIECSECGIETLHIYKPKFSVVERWNTRSDATLRSLAQERDAPSFQTRVDAWMQACFGPAISKDQMERNHRFFEEAGELVQSKGMTREEAHQLVDYTWDRPVGDPEQEVGGVEVTLAALCLASGMDKAALGERELARIWTKVETIRQKQLTKPKASPLPAYHNDRASLRAENERLKKPWPQEDLGNGQMADVDPLTIIANLEAKNERLKGELAEALSYAQTFCKHFVKEHFPESTSWNVVPDLLGVLMQIDNASTIAQELRTALTAAQQRLAEAEKVIAPIAKVAETDIGDDESDSDRFKPISPPNNRSPLLTVGDLRAARDYLAASGGEKEGDGDGR